MQSYLIIRFGLHKVDSIVLGQDCIIFMSEIITTTGRNTLCITATQFILKNCTPGTNIIRSHSALVAKMHIAISNVETSD